MRALIATLLLLCSTLGQASGLGPANTGFGQVSGPEFLPVEEAYVLAAESGEPDGLRLYWQIADGYYLYQHAFKFSLVDSAGDVATTPAFPPAIERSDEFFGEVRVYYNSVDINLATDRPVGDGARLSVTSQGFADAGLCYPPRTQHFEYDSASGALTEVAGPARRAQPEAAAGKATSGSLPSLFLHLCIYFCLFYRLYMYVCMAVCACVFYLYL